MSGQFGGNQPPPGGFQGGGQPPSYPGGPGYDQPGPGQAYPGPGTGYPPPGSGYPPPPGDPYGQPPHPGGQGPAQGMFYKGSQYGLPWSGPGSLAGQWARLAARLIDAICLLPVTIPVFVLMFTTHAVGTVQVTTASGTTVHTFSILNWGLFILFSAIDVVAYIAYEAILIQMAGRTVGKIAMGMRIVTIANPQQTVSPSQGAKRLAVWTVPQLVPFAGGIWGLVNLAFCLGDSGRQCLHDKAVKTLVVSTK